MLTTTIIDTGSNSIAELCEQIGSSIGNEKPLESVVKYAIEQGCKTIVEEHGYVDAEFLDEFNSYHAKNFRTPARSCTRLHFLKTSRSHDQKKGISYLDNIESTNYVGFAVIRPLLDKKIGRTLLSSPCNIESDDITVYPTCEAEFTSTINNQTLIVRGAPFIQSDRRVMVCAQAAIWMAIRCMHQSFGYNCHRPSDITKSAMLNRSYRGYIGPGEGLDVEDTMNALTNIGFSPLSTRRPKSISDQVKKRIDETTSKLSKREKSAKNDEFRALEKELIRQWAVGNIYRYVESCIPVILTVRNKNMKDNHALCVVGHIVDKKRPIKGLRDLNDNFILPSSFWTSAFIVHDDASGPYQILPVDELARSRINYRNFSEYSIDDVQEIIVPVPRDITLPSQVVNDWTLGLLIDDAINYKAIVKTKIPETNGALEYLKSMKQTRGNPVISRTYLMRSDEFKLSLRLRKNSMSSGLADLYNRMVLPKCIWISEISNKRRLVDDPEKTMFGEILYDATAHKESRSPVLSLHLPGFIRSFDDQSGHLGDPIYINDDKPYPIPDRYCSCENTRHPAKIGV